jgi:hypothetical protein
MYVGDDNLVRVQEEVLMFDTTRAPKVRITISSSETAPQIQIRSGVRAGGAGGSCDVAYWRKELNYWRNLAEKMGCA